MLIDDFTGLPVLQDEIDITPVLEFGRTELKDAPSHVLADEIPQHCNFHHTPLTPIYQGMATSGLIIEWRCLECDPLSSL